MVKSIEVRVEDGLAIVEFATPDRGNPLDGQFSADFRDVFLDLWNRVGEVRAVLIRAQGKNFSVGGDLKSFASDLDNLDKKVREWTAALHMGLQRAWQLPVPIVCAVQGFAMGGAVALLAGCDVVLAAESSQFGSAFAKLGFSCDSGSSMTLTSRMGPARARRFVLLGEMLNAREALQSGLVDRVIADNDLEDEALKLARTLSKGPTQAYGQIKRLFLRAGHTHLEAQLEDEALTLARVATSADAREGITAMLERRQSVFVGE